jgi:serine/threonine protein kinase
MSEPNQSTPSASDSKDDKECPPKNVPEESRPTTNVPEASSPTTNVPDSLATRLEGRDVQQPDAREYARYDRQKEASVRIQMISERMSALERSPINKSSRSATKQARSPVQTPEELAAAAAVAAYTPKSNEGSSVGSPQSSCIGGVSGPKSRELSLAIGSSAEDSSDDRMITAQMRAAMLGCGMQYIRQLGHGTYGQVAMVELNKQRKAVKLVDVGAHEFRWLRKVLRRELHVQSNVSPHPHLMPIEKVMRFGRIILCMMPLAINGDLYEYIRKRGYLNEQSACRLFYQLCRGVEHLHLNGYAHRDLKCENVLLDANLDIKLTDFGVTCSLKPAPRTPELATLDSEMSQSTEQHVQIWSLDDVRRRQALEEAADQASPTKRVSPPESPVKSPAKSEPNNSIESKPSPAKPTFPPPDLTSKLDTDSTAKGLMPNDMITVYRKCELTDEERKRAKNIRIMSEDNEVQFTQTHCGSLLYACPELLNRELYDPRLADVWSLGVILWVMLFNCYPYEDRRTAVHALAANTCVFEIPYRPPISDACKTLLRKVLVKEDFRLRLSEVLESDWISANKPNFPQDIQTVDSSGLESRPSLSYRQNTGTFDV